MAGIIAVTFIFGGGTVFLLAISPIGRAIASRIKGTSGSSRDVQAMQDLMHEVLDDNRALREEMVELQERVDFAERMIAQQRQDQLPPHN